MRPRAGQQKGKEGLRRGVRRKDGGGDIQDKDDMFTRYIPFTSIWAIASWSRADLDRLPLALSFRCDCRRHIAYIDVPS